MSDFHDLSRRICARGFWIGPPKAIDAGDASRDLGRDDIDVVWKPVPWPYVGCPKDSYVCDGASTASGDGNGLFSKREFSRGDGIFLPLHFFPCREGDVDNGLSGRHIAVAVKEVDGGFGSSVKVCIDKVKAFHSLGCDAQLAQRKILHDKDECGIAAIARVEVDWNFGESIRLDDVLPLQHGDVCDWRSMRIASIADVYVARCGGTAGIDVRADHGPSCRRWPGLSSPAGEDGNVCERLLLSNIRARHAEERVGRIIFPSMVEVHLDPFIYLRHWNVCRH